MNKEVKVAEHHWKNTLWLYLVFIGAIVACFGGFFAIMHFIVTQPMYY